ncbi:hypothetical protein LAZ67_22001343, partial [Cordylochernes scorpioides]
MVETRSGKMQDPAQERIQAEESAKPQPGATIGRDASSDPVVLNPNIDIPKYDGTEDPRPWIESLEEIGFLYHWADYIISRYAAMNMTGSAKTWLNLHKASFTSWENIKIRLIQDFSLDANKEELRMKLNRMQHWNEPAIRFAEDILVLCNKVDPAMEEETKIEHVIGGLKKEYSFALYLNPPKTTDDLLVVCKKMDSFEKKYRERVEKSRNLYNGPRYSRPQQQSRYVPPTAARNYQTTSRPQAPVSNNYKNDSPPTPRQYRNNFPQPSTPRRPYNPNFVPKPNLQRNTYNKSQEVSKNRTEDGRPICFKCNKPGHVARYCRVKFIRILEEDPADTQEKIFRVGRFKLSVAPESVNQSKSTINGIKKLDPKYKLKINVDKIGTFEALVDTGADLSVVDLRTALDTGHGISKLAKICAGPDGKKLDMVGSIFLNIKIDDETLSHNFVILKTHLRTLILGRDFLKKMNAKIDCKQETIKYDLTNNHDEIKFEMLKIKSAKDSIVPECSMKLIKALVETEDGEYIIEESSKMFQTNGLRLAKGLINVINRETHIWITNPYPRPLKIMKNQTLAFGSSPAKINVSREREVEKNEEPRFQINENLSPKEQKELKQVLERYGDLFSSRLGRTNLAKHRIDTEDAKPIKHKPYRVSAKERDIIKEQIDEMLTEGIIGPSSSPWSFPVILVKKRDGKYRFCVDYRKLNNVTVKDVYPISRIDEVMDTLQGSTHFSAIDLRSGYWQVEVEERDKEKTAFTTAHGLYEFNVMPFGLCNAPATFERNMENMLGNLRWQICLCYLDDVIIYSPDFPTHLKRLEAVFRCFRESNLRLNDKKCRFAFEELEILGYITSKHGIKPAEHNIKAVRNFPRPKKVKEVQSFLGMCSYYRKFIKDFSKIADPLTNLIKKSVSFTWTERQEEAFQTLKTALLSPPILGHFNPNAPTYVHTDASNIGIGATLVQDIGGEEKVISYLSRTLSKAEQNYSTTEKECLAVVWSMSKLRPYLYGRHFKIVTDHHALCWLKNLKDPTGRLARWALKIQEYDFDIIHKSGKKHLDADGLSRGPLPETDWDEDFERLFLNQITDEEDKFIESVKKNLNGSRRSIAQNFKEEDGCLFKKNPNPEGRAWLLVVPENKKREIMKEYHNHMSNGHLGVARTMYRIKSKYFWPSMLKDVSEFVKTCHLCQSRKGSNQLPSGLLQPIPPANFPFERIGIDFVGPLPSTKNRKKWIIVLTDYYTRYAETRAVSEATVKEVSKFLVEDIFLRHGAPQYLISDRGSQFTSNLMKEEDLWEVVTENIPDEPKIEWKKKDSKARAIINLSIADSQIVHVKNLLTAKATWDTLKNIYERKTLSGKIYLLRKLYSLKLEEDKDMQQHITTMMELVDKLRTIGETLKDSHITAILLCSLPKSYSNLITMLESRPDDELTLEFTKNKLLDEHTRRVESSKDESTESKALKSLHRASSQRREKEKKFCSFCHKPNHSKEECWHYQKRNNSNKEYKYENFRRGNVPKYTNQSSVTQEQPTNQRTTKGPNPKALNCTQREASVHNWFVDSGATSHMAYDESFFTELNREQTQNVVVANGNKLQVKGIGQGEIKVITPQGKTDTLLLTKVLYIPELTDNLLSVSAATSNGCKVTFNRDWCTIERDNTALANGILDNGMYRLHLDDNPQTRTFKANVAKQNHCKNKNCLMLWHDRLGHRNIESIKKIRNENLARGLSLNNCSHSTDCVQCIQGKLTETPFPKKTEYRATETLQLVHSDICGPLPTNSLSGKRYFLTFTDDYSRYTKIYLLKGKDEAYEKIKDYVISAHTDFGKNIQTIRTDNGREYVNRQVEDFLNQSGIKHQLTVPYSPAQNGVAERKNRSLMEMTRCMLFDSGLPQSLWAEAVTTANYLHNRIPSKATDKTPFELWTNRKPSLKHLKRFGCKAFAYIPKIKRNKLDSKVIEGIFLGYDDRSKGYRILHDTDNITISRSVKFIEKENGFHHASTKTTSPQVLSTDLTSSNHIGNAEESQEPGTQSENLEDSETEDYLQPSTSTGTQVVTQRRSTRPTKGIPPIRNDYMLYKTEAQDIQTPTNYSEVLQLPKIEREKWLQAMNEELNSLEKNNVWELTPLPKDKKIIGCKWTYKQKLNSKGEIERYKARLVAKGFNQKFGRDYEETFAPIVKHSTIRAFLAASVYKGMQVIHLDVKTAFLHGDLDKELYMELPEGLHTKQTNEVCKLKKAIYGLKQAGRSWNTKIASTLIKNNFKQSIVDPCLFTKNEENHSIYLILYVDDMLLASDSEIIIQNTVKTLEKEFEIKYLGDPTQFIGIEISRNREGELLLSQKNKIQELVERYNLQEAKPTFTPMESGYPGISDEKLLPNNVQYQQLIGSLLYLSVVSRPDIAAPVCILSSRNQNPRNCDWNAAKRIVRYLKTTKELELRISNQKPPTLEAYSDATWASDNTDRKSLSGNLFLLGSNPISWMTGKQGCVSLSSTEAELISAAEASQELLWLLDLLKDLELEQKAPIYFHQDNQSCLKICSSEKVSSRTKHIATKIHHLKDLQKKTVIKMIYCPTGDMKADILTKPLPRPTFEKLRYNLVMVGNMVSPFSLLQCLPLLRVGHMVSPYLTPSVSSSTE